MNGLRKRSVLDPDRKFWRIKLTVLPITILSQIRGASYRFEYNYGHVFIQARTSSEKVEYQRETDEITPRFVKRGNMETETFFMTAHKSNMSKKGHAMETFASFFREVDGIQGPMNESII
jgi:DNA-directed RNA polymerase